MKTTGAVVRHALFLVFSIAGPFLQGGELQTILLSGQQAPGVAAGGLFSGFEAPHLNNSGRIAFNAGLSSMAGLGIWSNGNGPLTLVANQGQQAPGAALGQVFGVSKNGAGMAAINFDDLGHIAFGVPLQGPGGPKTDDPFSIWRYSNGQLELIAMEGAASPGVNGAVFDAIYLPQMDVLGHISFLGQMRQNIGGVDTHNRGALWSDRSGALALLYRQGDSIAGAPGYPLFDDFGVASTSGSGELAFSSYLTGPGAAAPHDKAVFLDQAGAVGLVVLGGTQAPGLSKGTSFYGFRSVLVNDSDQLAIDALLPIKPGSEFATPPQGIWAGSAGSLRLVAVQGGQAPGTPAGARFSDFDQALMRLNGAGHVAFNAALLQFGGGGVDISNNTGIWKETDAGAQLVARFGSQAPGLPAGAKFWPFFYDLAFNDAAQVAFQGRADGVSYGIWAQDRSGDLKLIACTGQMINVGSAAAPDWREISALRFDKSGLNDRGQVAFTAVFTDASQGIFISNLVAVPEPATACLLVALGVGLACRRRNAEDFGFAT